MRLEAPLGSLRITKSVEHYHTTQGFEFEVRRAANNELVGRFQTNVAGEIYIPNLLAGDFVVREIVPEGFLEPENNPRTVTVEAGRTANLATSTNFHNRRIRGRISLQKFTDIVNPNNPQIMPPLENATFEVYLASAGSFDAARENERAVITTDRYGRATTPLLPWGVYRVVEVCSGGADVRLVDPFYVFISEQYRTYYFNLLNPMHHSLLRVIKRCSLTNEVIQIAGTEFRIFCLRTNDFIGQQIFYPTPHWTDTFRTSSEGMLTLPNPLPSGDYLLYEIRSPYGFLLSEEPVPFRIHSSIEEVVVNGVPAIEVTKYNEPVRGQISIYKQGEMLAGVENIETDFGMSYNPTFSLRYLRGVVFHIYAAEDITVAGIIKYRQGELVDTIITGRGRSASRELFLGEYKVIEQYAKHSFFRDPTVHRVSLSFEDQYTPLVSEDLRLENMRQRVEISLLKHLERPDGLMDYSAYENVRFGLFARYDIFCFRGRKRGGNDDFNLCDSYYCDDDYCDHSDIGRIAPIIPADSLIEVINVDALGRGIAETCLPHGYFYIRELATGGPAWLIDEREFDIVFSWDCQDTSVVYIHVGGEGEDGEPYVIVNYLVRGEIRILKRCSATVNTLEGVVFGLYRDGELLYERTTQTDGIASFEGIHFGQVQIRELYGLEGFIVTDEVFAVSITEDGEIIEITVYNEPMPEPDNPVTGDILPVRWAAILTASAATFTGLALNNRRKTKKTKAMEGK